MQSRPRSPLQNRQIVIRNLQYDTCHGGTVLRANRVSPGTVGALPRYEFVANRWVPVSPPLSPSMPHCLNGIVLAIKVKTILGLGCRFLAQTERGNSIRSQSLVPDRLQRYTKPPLQQPSGQIGFWDHLSKKACTENLHHRSGISSRIRLSDQSSPEAQQSAFRAARKAIT